MPFHPGHRLVVAAALLWATPGLAPWLALLYVQPMATLLAGVLLLKERLAWPEFAGSTLAAIAALLHLTSGHGPQHHGASRKPVRSPQ